MDEIKKIIRVLSSIKAMQYGFQELIEEYFRIYDEDPYLDNCPTKIFQILDDLHHDLHLYSSNPLHRKEEPLLLDEKGVIERIDKAFIKLKALGIDIET
jgi:hypothetical protein